MATADVAAKAACWLLDRGWSGHHRVGRPLGFGRAAHARHDDPHGAHRVRADHARARDPRQALTFAAFTQGEPWARSRDLFLDRYVVVIKPSVSCMSISGSAKRLVGDSAARLFSEQKETTPYAQSPDE